MVDLTNLRVIYETLDAINGGEPPSKPPLNDGGNGGNSPGMEPRVAKLEAHMEHVRSELAKLSAVPVELAKLQTKVDHLPGKGFIVSAAGTALVMVTGLLVLLQKIGVLH